jgi:hypothetical protein
MFGIGRPELELAHDTFRTRRVRKTGGWFQDAVQAACLGDTETAKTCVVSNFSTRFSGSRFPAFWGPNYDWVPDQDHGSVAMTALQEMLLQANGSEIHLLPAWPAEWDVDFKLHAPDHTVVEVSVRGGKLERLIVLPEARRSDIRLPSSFSQ